MPRTRGESRIPADRIHRFVEVDTPVVEYVHPPAEGVAEQIARYVARLVDDGATLQVGLGRVPNRMLEVEQATMNAEAVARLDALREQLGLPMAQPPVR